MLDLFQHFCKHYSRLHTEECTVTGWKSFVISRASASESEDTHQTQGAVTKYKKTLKLLASLRLYNHISHTYTHRRNKEVFDTQTVHVGNWKIQASEQNGTYRFPNLISPRFTRQCNFEFTLSFWNTSASSFHTSNSLIKYNNLSSWLKGLFP
jgi:hypothetical protein